MMRLTMALFWGLVICWLLARPAQAQPAPSTAPWPREVEGKHLSSHDKAKQIALEEARALIIDFLRKQKPPMKSWQPTLLDVEKMIAREEKDLFTEGTFTFKRSALTLKTLDTRDLDKFRQLDRQAYADLERNQREHRRSQRLLLTSKAVLAILFLLCAVVGYIRLDDLTRRSYSLWLRLGLGAAAVSTGVGLWLLR